MSDATIFTQIGAAERIIRSLQDEVDAEHPSYALLGAALANLSEAAFELQENGAGR